jgi:hypothetical protein
LRVACRRKGGDADRECSEPGRKFGLGQHESLLREKPYGSTTVRELVAAMAMMVQCWKSQRGGVKNHSALVSKITTRMTLSHLGGMD